MTYKSDVLALSDSMITTLDVIQLRLVNRRRGRRKTFKCLLVVEEFQRHAVVIAISSLASALAGYPQQVKRCRHDSSNSRADDKIKGGIESNGYFKRAIHAKLGYISSNPVTQTHYGNG